LFCYLAAEAPIFVASPKDLIKVAVGHTAVLTCKVAGAPKPSLVWQKGADLIDVRDLHDPRITVLPSGDLQIEVNNISVLLNDICGREYVFLEQTAAFLAGRLCCMFDGTLAACGDG
jgi:hypothetical protein